MYVFQNKYKFFIFCTTPLNLVATPLFEVILVLEDSSGSSPECTLEFPGRGVLRLLGRIRKVPGILLQFKVILVFGDSSRSSCKWTPEFPGRGILRLLGMIRRVPGILLERLTKTTEPGVLKCEQRHHTQQKVYKVSDEKMPILQIWI